LTSSDCVGVRTEVCSERACFDVSISQSSTLNSLSSMRSEVIACLTLSTRGACLLRSSLSANLFCSNGKLLVGGGTVSLWVYLDFFCSQRNFFRKLQHCSKRMPVSHLCIQAFPSGALARSIISYLRLERPGWVVLFR
jgi:hypothetical protein